MQMKYPRVWIHKETAELYVCIAYTPRYGFVEHGDIGGGVWKDDYEDLGPL